MVTRRVVLITGAGASLSYGMPDGRTLKERIVEGLLEINSPANVCVRLLYGDQCRGLDVNAYGARLKKSPVPSIDAFLEVEENSRQFMRIAKASIAWHILRAECSAHYACNGDLRHEDDWLSYLFNRLVSGAKHPEDLEQNAVTILTFNFDRAIEFRWLDTLVSHFGIQGPALERAFATLPIHHVHGAVTPDTTAAGLLKYPLRSDVDRELVGMAAEHIKLVHDEVPGSDAVEGALASAQTLCFLGLSYAPLNLRRLGFPRHQPGRYSPVVYGTTIGMGEGEVDAARDHLMGTARDILSCDLRPVRCKELLRERRLFNDRDRVRLAKSYAGAHRGTLVRRGRRAEGGGRPDKRL